MNMKKYTTVALAATMAVGTVIPASAASIDKIVGDNRYETAAMISKRAYSNADTVILVNDDAIPDALAATPYANALKAPILLTSKNALTAVTKDEIVRTGAKKVVLIGGEAVLPEALVEELKAAGVTTVDRIKGDTREETALEMAKALNDFNKANKLEAINSVAVVNGTNGLADAVSVAAIAAKNNAPVVIVGSKLSDSQKSLFKNKVIKTITQVGGNGNEDAVEEIKATQTSINYEVNNKEDLETVLANVNAGDTITLKTNADTSSDFAISTDKAINIKINGTFKGKVSVDASEAKVDIVGGSIKELEIKRVASLDIIFGVEVERPVLDTNAEGLPVTNKGTITKVEINAAKVILQNDGIIKDKITGTATDYILNGKQPESEQEKPNTDTEVESETK